MLKFLFSSLFLSFLFFCFFNFNYFYFCSSDFFKIFDGHREVRRFACLTLGWSYPFACLPYTLKYIIYILLILLLIYEPNNLVDFQEKTSQNPKLLYLHVSPYQILYKVFPITSRLVYLIIIYKTIIISFKILRWDLTVLIWSHVKLGTYCDW